MTDDKLREVLRSCIEAYLAGRNPGQSTSGPMHDAVRHHRFLPVEDTWTDQYGISEDGTPVVWHSEPPADDVTRLAHPVWRRILYFHAAKVFPALSPWVESKPENAVTCEQCGGQPTWPWPSQRPDPMVPGNAGGPAERIRKLFLRRRARATGASEGPAGDLWIAKSPLPPDYCCGSCYGLGWFLPGESHDPSDYVPESHSERPLITNLKVLKESRHQPRAGDVFVMQLPTDQFLFGRVVCTDANPHGEGTGILIYVFAEQSPDKSSVPSLSPASLLIPPTMTNRLPWTMGIFEHVEHRPIQTGDALPVHAFEDLGGMVVDEHGNPLEPPIPKGATVGLFALSSYRLIDDTISKALGIPLAPYRYRAR